MYLDINGGKIYYQKVGKGRDLIILHGWKQDVSSFWEVSEKLKDSFKIWLIDLPGFGRSDESKQSFTILDYAKIIFGFISKNKIKNPILFGHSLGGNVSIKLAALHPKLIDKLILEDSSGIRPQNNPFKLLLYLLAKIFHYLIPNIFGIKDKIRHKLYQKLESDYFNAGNLKGTLINILNEDLTDDLPKIRCETLIIWGENDQVVKLKYGKKMYQLISDSKIEIIENSGHFPHLENPERFVYYVKLFCE